MQVSVEKTSELSRKMTVSVPEDVVQEKIEARLKSLARDVKIDGFRKGKVPPQLVKKMFGDRVRGEIAGDLIQSTFYQALHEQDLKPAGYPHIDSAEESEGLKYTAVFEVYPEISLDGIDGLEVKRPVAAVVESDIDGMIEKLRAQKKEWHETVRPSQDQDRVTINFSGISEGENFTGGDVENYAVIIGSKQMIPGFEDNLIGVMAGDNKSLELAFPENYGNTKLAGKQAEFKINVIKIEEPVLPEIDENFIKAYGIEDGSLESFREDIRNTMERELDQALRGRLKNAVMDALYEHIKVTLPNTLIDHEIENLMKPYEETAKKRNMKLEELNIPRDVFEDQAKRRVALGLILGEVIHQNEIKLDDNKVRSTIEDMSKNYERPQDVISWYYSDEKSLHDVEQMVLEDQAVDWLVDRSKITDQALSFSEVMENQQR